MKKRSKRRIVFLEELILSGNQLGLLPIDLQYFGQQQA